MCVCVLTQKQIKHSHHKYRKRYPIRAQDNESLFHMHYKIIFKTILAVIHFNVIDAKYLMFRLWKVADKSSATYAML